MILIVKSDLSSATMQHRNRTLSVRSTRIHGLYRVTQHATGTEFVTNFFELKNGRNFSRCNCRKRPGHMCSHLSLAACLHVLVTAAKRRPRTQ
jgi:hypothetical protein